MTAVNAKCQREHACTRSMPGYVRPNTVKPDYYNNKKFVYI